MGIGSGTDRQSRLVGNKVHFTGAQIICRRRRINLRPRAAFMGKTGH